MMIEVAEFAKTKAATWGKINQKIQELNATAGQEFRDAAKKTGQDLVPQHIAELNERARVYQEKIEEEHRQQQAQTAAQINEMQGEIDSLRNNQ